MIRRRWWIIGLVAISLFVLELYEDSFGGLDLFHLVEYLIYVFFLVIIGVLITLMMRVLESQVRTLKILDYKHKIDLEIISHPDWNVLTHELVKFPAMIAPVGAANLFVRNPITGQFELEAHKVESGFSTLDISMAGVCPVCQAHLMADPSPLIQCAEKPGIDGAGGNTAVYCLAIRDCQQILAILSFRMLPGKTLNAEQKNILQTIAEDLLVALKAGQDHKMLVELREAQATLKERRKVSHFLHDSLGQNLSFINLKVSQWISDKKALRGEILQKDLERLREAAGASQDIVRGILEANEQGTMPLLSNLLLEHGAKVSQRANFEIVFDIKGEPSPVLPDIERAVFYVFQEALSNIEKHAQANKVKVGIRWGANDLEISVEDDGLGFQPDAVSPDHHFGLSIMHERIDRIHGQMEVISAENAGTIVKICIPISAPSLEKILQN